MYSLRCVTDTFTMPKDRYYSNVCSLSSPLHICCTLLVFINRPCSIILREKYNSPGSPPPLALLFTPRVSCSTSQSIFKQTSSELNMLIERKPSTDFGETLASQIFGMTWPTYTIPSPGSPTLSQAFPWHNPHPNLPVNIGHREYLWPADMSVPARNCMGNTTPHTNWFIWCSGPVM